MPTELPKNYDPSAIEPAVYQAWLDARAFEADPAAPGEPYSIVIPPPNVTGALHLGHAINNTLQDILIRKARMEGKNALWIPGIDHAGIATQAVVEKQLKEKENQTRHDIGREALVQRIWDWKQEYGDRILNQLQRLGCSCDWSRTRFTLDEGLARAVRETFFKLFKDGLVYRGKRLVNWDTHLQTSISDDEIYHETVKTNLWHVRYPIVEKSGTGFQPVHGLQTHATHLTVATTRPETMLGDTAVAVHSEDPRWNWAIGQFVKLPLTDRLIPIIADNILVDPKFGSGVVKVTPAHDPNDYAVWQRHQNQPDQIDLINILNSDGTLNENAGPYKGLKREAARKKVVEDLEAQGLLEKTEPYETQVGHSDRSKTPIEPYLSDQWFVKMAPLAEPALEVVRQGLIQFFPERHAQQYLAWLGEKRDWPISRQLWWGHRIPVWTREEFPSNDGFEPLENDTRRDAHSRLYIDNVELPIQRSTEGIKEFSFVAVPPGYPIIEKKLSDLGYTQDPDVLDTWFSSALWPFSTLGWPEPTADLQKYYPTSVLLTGRDIITLWVARMVMMGLYDMGMGAFLDRCSGVSPVRAADTGETPVLQAIPFHHVAINPTILDGKGERMSKSKGNGVDPVEIIDIYGADALRFTVTTMATETQDVRMPVKKDAQGRNTSEKFDAGRNFCNKLWNAARFALASLEAINPLPNPPPQSTAGEGVISLADRWITSRLSRAIDEANKSLSIYRFDQYAKTCYDFFWGDFCDWYLEAIKPALRDPTRAPQTARTLAHTLDAALRLMHPMIPFITETLWGQLTQVYPDLLLSSPRPLGGEAGPRSGAGEGGASSGESASRATSPLLIRAPWPAVGPFNEDAEHIFPRLQGVITAIRNLRNEYKIDPKKPVKISLAPPGDEAVRVTHENRELIELLAICTITTLQSALPQPPDSVHAIANGCDIFMENKVDPEAEKQRLAAERAKLQKQIDALKARLTNESYIAKAPAHLVQQTRDQLAQVEREIEKLAS
jgi:valyl-tRNA synthetase